MKIGELSRRSGVSTRSLRYYEEHGLLTSHRDLNGYREYDEPAVGRAETIHLLFGMDFPRDVVQSVLACTGEVSDDLHDDLATKLTKVQVELGERIQRLSHTHQRVSAFLEARQS